MSDSKFSYWNIYILYCIVILIGVIIYYFNIKEYKPEELNEELLKLGYNDNLENNIKLANDNYNSINNNLLSLIEKNTAREIFDKLPPIIISKKIKRNGIIEYKYLNYNDWSKKREFEVKNEFISSLSNNDKELFKLYQKINAKKSFPIVYTILVGWAIPPITLFIGFILINIFPHSYVY